MPAPGASTANALVNWRVVPYVYEIDDRRDLLRLIAVNTENGA
jgi:hypothetical protein